MEYTLANLFFDPSKLDHFGYRRLVQLKLMLFQSKMHKLSKIVNFLKIPMSTSSSGNVLTYGGALIL